LPHRFVEQTVPQAPQLFGSEAMATSQLPSPQFAKPVGQAGHEAQLLSAHGVTSSEQRHCELAQICVAQATPQPPQLAGSLVVFVSHCPVWAQSAVPVLQLVVLVAVVQLALVAPSGQAPPLGHWQLHWPPEQVLLELPVEVAQEAPQLPQLAGSTLTSWQPCPSPQSCWPLEQQEESVTPSGHDPEPLEHSHAPASPPAVVVVVAPPEVARQFPLVGSQTSPEQQLPPLLHEAPI
jgi:hypothetical protein